MKASGGKSDLIFTMMIEDQDALLLFQDAPRRYRVAGQKDFVNFHSLNASLA